MWKQEILAKNNQLSYSKTHWRILGLGPTANASHRTFKLAKNAPSFDSLAIISNFLPMSRNFRKTASYKFLNKVTSRTILRLLMERLTFANIEIKV